MKITGSKWEKKALGYNIAVFVENSTTLCDTNIAGTLLRRKLLLFLPAVRPTGHRMVRVVVVVVVGGLL